MALPTFSSISHKQSEKSSASQSHGLSEDSPPSYRSAPSGSTVKHATRTRLVFALLTSIFFLISLVFIVLVEIGNTSGHKRIVGSIWFLRLDLSKILPESVPKGTPYRGSVARMLGLHDFYQVGLWNFCEGYSGEIAQCGKPKTLYWFNPVQILLDEMLAGAKSKIIPGSR